MMNIEKETKSKVKVMNEALRKQLNEMPQRLYTPDELKAISELDRLGKYPLNVSIFKTRIEQLEKVLMYFNNYGTVKRKYTIDHNLMGRVYKIDKTLSKNLGDQIFYFQAINNNEKVEKFACVKSAYLYKDGQRPLKACVKSLIWKDIGSNEKGSMIRFLFSYVCKDYECIVSDSLYSSLGEKSLDNIIKDSFKLGDKIGVCCEVRNTDNVEFIHYLDSYDDYIESKKKYFGDDSIFSKYHYFIEFKGK